MKIFKAKVGSDDGSIYDVDAIEHRGKLWLVPNWLDTKDGKQTTPARLIRFDNLPHQDMRGSALCDFALSVPVPKALLDFPTPKQAIPGFEVVELPAMKRGQNDTLQ